MLGSCPNFIRSGANLAQFRQLRVGHEHFAAGHHSRARHAVHCHANDATADNSETWRYGESGNEQFDGFYHGAKSEPESNSVRQRQFEPQHTHNRGPGAVHDRDADTAKRNATKLTGGHGYGTECNDSWDSATTEPARHG